jgi:hypothetical protein
VKTEEDGFDPDPTASSRKTLAAIRYLDEIVPTESSLTGIVLRYGGFYGGHSGISRDGDMIQLSTSAASRSWARAPACGR